MIGVTGVPTLYPPVGERDHILGPATAPVTLVEYGDYECPYCGAAHPVVKEIRRQLGNELRFAFRHFPLTRVHPHAEHAAEAAEATGAQGRPKFWQMHDMLYEHQDALDDEDLECRRIPPHFGDLLALAKERSGRQTTKVPLWDRQCRQRFSRWSPSRRDISSKGSPLG